MKIGILGAGRMGITVAEHLQNDDRVQQFIAYDPHQPALDAFSQQFNMPVTRELDRVLDDPDIPLVFITASNDAHKSLTLRAIESGKAVMCEKPIATTLADAQVMGEASERMGTFLQIGFELRYAKLFTRVKQWIDEGLLGRVVNTHCFYTISEYWGSSSWRVGQEASGGMFAEKLSHYVDLPRWWIGGNVTQVHSVCSPNIIPYFEIRDNYHTTYRFDNGSTSHLTFMMGPPATFNGDPLFDALEEQRHDGHNLRYLIVGTHGAAATSVFDRTLKRWAFDPQNDSFTSKIVEEHTWSRDEDHFYTHNTTDQTHDVITRVLEGSPPATSAHDAYETMKLTFAAEQSADLGQPVEIEAFVPQP